MLTMTRTTPGRVTLHRQSGAFLLEALIAILIFSMGILALVGLQAASISTVSEAKYRTDAAYHANRIIGEMWVDLANLATYACDPCTTSSGNAKTQAWVADIQGSAEKGLPGVTDAANQPSIVVNGNTVTVTLRWQVPRTSVVHNHVATAYISGP